MGDFDLNYYKDVIKYTTKPDISQETSPQSNNALKWVQYKIAEEIIATPDKIRMVDDIQQKWMDVMKTKLKKKTEFEEEEIFVKPSLVEDFDSDFDAPTLPPKVIPVVDPPWKAPLETIDTIVDNTEGIVYKDLQTTTKALETVPTRELIETDPEKESSLIPPITNEIYIGDNKSVYLLLIFLIFIFLIK